MKKLTTKKLHVTTETIRALDVNVTKIDGGIATAALFSCKRACTISREFNWTCDC